MRSLLVILFSFFCFLGYSQYDPPPGYIPRKGFPYFVKDAKGKIIGADIAGAFSALAADTTSEYLVQPPDTIQSFTVTKAATDTFTSLLTEIKSYWTLEEAVGNAVDSVGTADLPLFGTVVQGETGIIGDCYSFATDGYIGNIDIYYEFNGSFTIACWMKSSNIVEGSMGLMCNFGTANRGWDLLLRTFATTNGYAQINIRNSLESVQSNSGTIINDNAWHHILASFNQDDDTLKIYVDGVLEDKDYATYNGPAYDDVCRFRIGSRYNQYYYTGFIDEPDIWNKELTQTEVDSLFAKSQYPFPYQGSGGKSVRIQNTGFDSRADSVMIIANPIGEGKSDSRIDGILLLAFNMADSAAYKDTTILWPYLKDTIYIIEAYTGLWPEDIWTDPPNYDTVFVDSSDVTPPDQDYPGIWDTIFYEDFEQHDAPVLYDRALFLADDWNSTYYNGEVNWRTGDFRYPQWYADNVVDSIVIDPISGSKVLRMMYAEGIHQGYDGQSGRGGENWRTPLPGAPYTEVYLSYNIMLRPGFDWSAGGKLAGGLIGGTNPGTGTTQPGYGDGFANIVQWGWDDRFPTQYNTKGVPGYYLFYQDMPHLYGQWRAFGEDFQPEGPGLTGRYNSFGNFVLDVSDSIWVNITLRCVTNTHTGATPNYDGIFEGYINGHLVVQMGGLYLITYPDIGNEIWGFYMYQSFGGGGPPLRNEWTYNDDIWVFTYDISVDVPRGNELSPPGRVLSLPGEHKWE